MYACLVVQHNDIIIGRCTRPARALVVHHRLRFPKGVMYSLRVGCDKKQSMCQMNVFAKSKNHNQIFCFFASGCNEDDDDEEAEASSALRFLLVLSAETDGSRNVAL